MSYLVCANQRSGTELLCRALAATGVAGRPQEYFLAEALIAASASETGWRQLYDELGLTPYQVVYEELSSPDGYEPTIRGVLAHLGLADYQGPIPAPQTRRQSNDLNEAWVAAYLADRTSHQH